MLNAITFLIIASITNLSIYTIVKIGVCLCSRKQKDQLPERIYWAARAELYFTKRRTFTLYSKPNLLFHFFKRNPDALLTMLSWDIREPKPNDKWQKKTVIKITV